jgi:hypothetical protein
MPSASDALTVGLGESGSGLDLADAERTCDLQSGRFFGSGVGVSDIYGGAQYVDDVKPHSIRRPDVLIIALSLYKT